MKPHGLILTLLGFLFLVVSPSRATDDLKLVSLSEAKILVVSSPAGEDLRRRGMDIGLELQTNSELKSDYFYFWVYNVKRTNSNGSVTIGYFAVNKHTGDLWDTDTKKLISSHLVADIQRIIREIHNIDEITIKQYRNIPF